MVSAMTPVDSIFCVLSVEVVLDVALKPEPAVFMVLPVAVRVFVP
jgi:hypothetical protein